MRKQRVGAGYLCGLLFAAGSVLPGCDTAKSLIQRVTGGSDTAAASATAAPSVPPALTELVGPVPTPSAIASVIAALPLAQLPASNEVKVKRFDDEKKLEKAPAKITTEKVEVREDPTPTSPVIATLARDAELVAVAQRGDQTLASFRNPAKPEEVLMGWMATPGVEVAPAVSSAASSPAPPAETAPAPTTTTPNKPAPDKPAPDKGKGTDKDKGKEPDKGKGDDKDDAKKGKKKKQKGDTL